jgi:hypothetical protein
MKLDPRYYPVLILTAFILFLLPGLLLGFGPERYGAGRRGALLVLEAVA